VSDAARAGFVTPHDCALPSDPLPPNIFTV